MKTSRNPETVYPPVAAYSHQIEVSGPERLLVLSGQIGQKPDGTIPEDAIEQVEIALDNVLRNLKAAQMNVEDLIKITFYLVGTMDAGQRRAAIEAKLGAHQPCMTLLYVTALAAPILKVEIDAWASQAI